jgi:hypothetical protein
VVIFSALHTGRPAAFTLQEIFLILISVRGWVEPRVIVWPGALCQWNIPMTLSGIEPATFQLLAYKDSYVAFNKPGQALIGMKCLTLVLSNSNFWSKIYQTTHFGVWISGLVGWVVSYSTCDDGLHSENFNTVNTVKTTIGNYGTDSQYIRDVP